MIIIDDKKYDSLLRKYLKHRVTLRAAENKEYLEDTLIHVSWKFAEEVKNELKIQLQPEHVAVLHTEHITSFDAMDFTVGFKQVETSISLLDDIDKVIEIPSNFRPPISVQVLRDIPRVEEWGGAATTIPYDVKQYWPWGYDLDRNVQVWKQK